MSKSYSLSPSEVSQAIDKLDRISYLVEDFIPSQSLCLLAGDSGQGKTPYAMQLSICIAAGIPFLGFNISPGTVLYADYENNLREFYIKCGEISGAIGLPGIPENLRRLEFPTADQIVADAKLYSPKLIVIDTLRYMDPKAETESHAAALRMTWMKQLGKYGATTIFLHHLRKDNEEAPRAPLEDLSTPVLTWMQNVSGSLALTNQSDIRIGFENSHKEDQVVVRAARRGFGDIGPWRLERIFDEYTGLPIAYKPLTGVELLTKLQKELILKFPLNQPLTFSEAMKLCGKSRRFTSDLLKTAVTAKLMEKQGTFKDTRYLRLL